MKKGFYAKLALTGIRKNRQTYVPYILTCIGMVMMFYIVSALSQNETLASMKGGDSLQLMLSFGVGVMGIFSLIFLFYTNSFLIRRRKKEFGLYNILGMNKWNLTRILVWECVILFAGSMTGGLFCGILFSKAGELCMANMLGEKAGFDFFVSFRSIKQTFLLFLVVFLLILLNTVRQIQMTGPVELLHGDETAEKPPKANRLLALIGVVVLGAAYYIAVSIEDPFTALVWFFIAVIMVIAATYLLFITGSVVLCRLLQKNRKFYYKANHFISVSSMVYRMKRNGAGLASICILSTMVLVTISSTVCLYIGAEDTLHRRYPRNIVAETYSLEQEYTDAVHESIDQIVKQHGEKPENMLYYRYIPAAVFFNESRGCFDNSLITPESGNIFQIFIVPLDDYNRIMDKEETLAENEVLIYCTKTDWKYDTIELSGIGSWKVKKTVDGFVDNGTDVAQIIPSVFMFVPDMEQMEEAMKHIPLSDGGELEMTGRDYYAFDLDCSDGKQIEILEAISQDEQYGICNLQMDDEAFPMVSVEGIAGKRSDFYGLYGGLFFLGIFLGIVFILGAVLIMYYKQIIEGYEDQKRFEILRKVGMTAGEIRKSINAQILMVFFLPLAAAGIHTAFSFPIVSKILLMLGLSNTRLLIFVTAGCYLLFAVFYTAVYMATSRVYYGIISGKKENHK